MALFGAEQREDIVNYMTTKKLSALFTPVRRGMSVTVAVSAVFLVACGTTTKKPVPIIDPPTTIAQAAKSELLLCKTRVRNPPPSNNRVVQRQTTLACAQGVELLIAPAPSACLTSGFGPRGGRVHRGIDYQSKPSGPVVAAGAGTVITKAFREKDFGNWIVIDHGQGVYTSYAHLASVAPGLTNGSKVSQGTTLGVMGSTGNATRDIHLHVEYRVGDIKNRKGYWGLKAIDPFKLPERCPVS